jgi:hypothetical protein
MKLLIFICSLAARTTLKSPERKYRGFYTRLGRLNPSGQTQI